MKKPLLLFSSLMFSSSILGLVGVGCGVDPILARRFPRWPLPVDPPASNYQDDGDTITDKTTGLVWEKNISGSTFALTDASTYCEDLALAGRDDWRLPSRIELLSLTNRSEKDPASTFPSMPSEEFWSSSPFAEDRLSPVSPESPSRTWTVTFAERGGVNLSSDRNVRVRCVRSDLVAAPNDQYTAAAETVTDNFTGLVWQRTVPDQTFTQEQAIAFCNDLTLAGSSDWRLPHILELESIIDDTLFDPTIDPTAFPNTPRESFWSSTPVSGDASHGWIAFFNRGISDGFNGDVNVSNRVRCVR